MYVAPATNIACPGCTASSGNRWHTCGIWSSEQDNSIKWVPPIAPTSYACTHCWCVEDRSKMRNVGHSNSIFGPTIFVTKVHEVCCGCGSRRATSEDIDPPVKD